MAWQQFSTLTAGNQNLSLFDGLAGQIAPCTLIPCSASGTNAIVLSGTANAPALAAYSDLVCFSFIAVATSTGSVTAQFGGLASLPVFYADGVTQVGAGGILTGQPYRLMWSQALAGFYLDQFGYPNPAASTAHGYNAALNLQVNASASSGVLTVSIKDASTGNDPSGTAPVNISFRDTVSGGGMVQLNVISALSVSTNAIGATLGIPNALASALPFSIWLVCFNNAGTPVLALWSNNTTPGSKIDESQLQSATGFTAGATSAATFYCPNLTTISNKAVRILARLDFASNANLSGTGWVGPTNIQLFGATVIKPGSQDRVLVNTLTPTNVGSLADSSSFLTGFDQYEIVFENVIPATATQAFALQVTSGGVNQNTSYIATGTCTISGTSSETGSTVQLLVGIGNVAIGMLAQAPGINAKVLVFNPQSTSQPKMWLIQSSYPASGHSVISFNAGFWNNNAALQGFNMFFTSGNIVSGTVRVYGLI